MTKIQWTEETWNPVVGCARVSPGCENCYAERVAHRGLTKSHRGLTVVGNHGPRWTGEARFVPEALSKPLHWRKPRRVFVNSMSDLFHDDITFGIPLLLECPAAVRFLSVEPLLGPVDLRLEAGECKGCGGEAVAPEVIAQHEGGCPYPGHDVLDDGGGRCVGCGQTLPPCPMCGPRHGRAEGLAVDWVIVGGESGPGARACDLSWIRSVVRQCDGARVACFVKQLGSQPRGTPPCTGCEGERFEGDACDRCGDVVEIEDGRRVLHLMDRKGGDPSEWPEDLRVQEFPEVRHG